jgi:hypothetical protein
MRSHPAKRQNRPARLRRFSGLAGVLGPWLFGSTLAALTLTQVDFMRSLGWDPLFAPTFDWPSGLALGPYGWLMTIVFVLSGSAMALFALGLRTALRRRSGRLGASLLLLAGLALAGLAFTTDPTLRSTPATWHGRLHDLCFVLLGLLLVPAMVVLGFAFKGEDRWRGFPAYSWISAALALPTFALKGVAFYIFLAAVLAWSEAVAIRFVVTGSRAGIYAGC